MKMTTIIDNILCGPPRDVEIPNGSFGQYILDALQNSQPKIIQIYPEIEKTLTNRELLEKSVKLASVLGERMNIKTGDVLAISSENIPNWFIAVCATIFCGATIAPMNHTYYEGEIRHCLSISRPKIIFVSRKTENLIQKIVKTLPENVELIQLEDESMCNINTIQSILINANNTPDPYKFRAVNIPQSRKQEFAILYSSGTTGLPKGVLLSHYNLFVVTFFLRKQQFTELFDKIIYLMLLPFFHGYGFSIMLFAMTAGCKAVIMQSFTPKLFCEIIQKYKITSIPLIPAVMVFLAKHPIVADYDFSSVKEIFCGAAPLSKKIRDDVLERFKNRIQIRHGYGMTELSAIVCISSPDTQKGETIGSLPPGTSCKIIEPMTSKTLEAYQTGELCFKGDHIMLEYRNDHEATRQMIRNDWLHTGDLGYCDYDGDLYICGRLKELIKYKGFQISPMEIENILLSNPDVEEAAVVGKNNEEAGQIPVAFVVKKKGSNMTEQQLRQFVDEKVSPQKRLRGGVQFVDSIPKNPSGKILRKKLEEITSTL